MVSHLIRCIAITYWISKSLRQFSMPVQKKSLKNYWKHHVHRRVCLFVRACLWACVYVCARVYVCLRVLWSNPFIKRRIRHQVNLKVEYCLSEFKVCFPNQLLYYIYIYIRCRQSWWSSTCCKYSWPSRIPAS